ncbi:hypothetical protein D3C78_1319010 [compost metagenome]
MLDARAQLPTVERARDHGAPPLLPSCGLGVVVREDRRHVELDTGLLGEEVNGLGAVGEEGIDAGLVEVRAGLVLQIGLGRSGRLLDALRRRQMCPRNPEPSARAGGGSAVLRGFLHHQDFEPLRRCRDGRGHA